MSARDPAPGPLQDAPDVPAGIALADATLRGEWGWLQTLAGAAASPEALDAQAVWLPAPVPGTVATAMRAAGRWDDGAPPPLHQHDHWYRIRFAGHGRRLLRFNGLATLAEVWLNGRLVLTARHMFIAHQAEVDLAGDNTLHLCFRALYPWLRTQRGRARWKPRMITPPSLRAVRTTLLGHMPGWCPPVHAVGPWRGVELLDPAACGSWSGVRAELRTRLDDGGDGSVRLLLRFPGPAPLAGHFAVRCGADGSGGADGPLHRLDSHTLAGELLLARPRLWWPHTHGEPHLYRVTARLPGGELDCGQVGLRTVALDGDAAQGAFALRVNGERVFCRGACVSSHDLPGLADTAEAVGPWLALARAAGMNMVRVSGVTCYPGEAFYRHCDEAGLMVWQDFMFANFDYGDDPEFMEAAAREVGQWLVSTGAHPSVAVLCGGSEAEQQAAMLGTARADWRQPLFDALIPRLVSEHRPDAVYVPNSPSGGAWPFQPDTGVSHYYGVGAYERPLADARLANVRFASECLAFANVPCARTLAEHGLTQPLHDPRWKARVPRDAGAAWDFEDVRDYYLRELYEVDPPRLRYERPQRYLMLSRAVVAELMSSVFAEWRRAGSTCAGGLVWQLQDLLPGAGWGIVDACVRPKSAWHALRDVWQPLQVLLSDEGLNGLHVHLINEGPRARRVRLELRCLRQGETVAAEARRELELAPRAVCRLEAAALLDRFFDMTYAYRFGPPAHDVVLAALYEPAPDGNAGAAGAAGAAAPLSQSVYLPERRADALLPAELRAELACEDGQWWLTVATRRFARWVHVEDHAWRAEQDWFHLGPGQSRRLRLLYDGPAGAAARLMPSGEVRALNDGGRPARYDA
ncbi:glycoside hydrolase family 2 protein [Cupriavidus malaysiensis]|uniref:beta-mannosidase n=1 Tax=Cupriavidus malaysiensis TaxID=367825 RepID=A0ABM6F9J1_9BURK|nr:glycoside hydrolase family 2 protein [Cupriavidus malaysiensis]AOZ08300.1 glycoside hydrolase [Cupriavidus malaysiensis]